MLALMLMLASAPDAIMGPGYIGSGFPESFRQGEVAKYIGCLRIQSNEAGETWNGPDPQSPEVVQFTQTMAYCRAERVRAAQRLRSHIQARHPDWRADRLSRSVEFVLSGFEIQLLDYFRRPEATPVHDRPEERF